MHTLLRHTALSDRLQHTASLIGNTPLLPIRRAFVKKGVSLYAKLEWQQLGQSVKARPAFHIIKGAIERGELGPGRRLLDATSGNTGIAYASICAALGIELTICIPENASQERKSLLKALGAELVFTSPFEGTDGAQAEAKALAASQPGRYYYADQYNNSDNWRAHYLSTAEEIFAQTGGQITHFVAGLGTTGTFVGTGRRLLELKPDITLVSLQPETALHGLEGWKDLQTAKVPGIYDPALAHAQKEVATMEAYGQLVHFARTEGILLSPSAAANLAGAIQLARELEEGTIVTIFPDDASKYGEVIDQLFSSIN